MNRALEIYGTKLSSPIYLQWKYEETKKKKKYDWKTSKLFGNLSFHVEKPTKIKVNTKTLTKRQKEVLKLKDKKNILKARESWLNHFQGNLNKINNWIFRETVDPRRKKASTFKMLKSKTFNPESCIQQNCLSKKMK